MFARRRFLAWKIWDLLAVESSNEQGSFGKQTPRSGVCFLDVCRRHLHCMLYDD